MCQATCNSVQQQLATALRDKHALSVQIKLLTLVSGRMLDVRCDLHINQCIP